MNKKSKTTILILALVIYAIIIAVCLMNDLTGPAIILGAFFLILAVCLGIYIREEPDEFSIFIKNKRRILKTYNSIIVEVEDIPNIAGKNIIKVRSIEDLVDAQLELREPIYYKNDNDSCFFMLLHYNEACIYILRMNADVVSPTEQSIKYMKEEPESKDNKESILENVENTIVYKLDELRSFKISPIRNNMEVKVIDDTAIKAEIENSKDNNITKEDLEDELSKTLYIKNLKEKMEEYEEEQEEKVLKEQLQAKALEKQEEKAEDIKEPEETTEENIEELPVEEKNPEPDILPIDFEEAHAPVKEVDKVIEELEKEVKEETKPKAKKTTKKKTVKSTHASRRASKYKKK